MIIHVWSVLCSQSISNAMTKNLSLIEVLEQLSITGPPLVEGKEGAIPITLDVASFWLRWPYDQQTRGSTRLLFLSPNGEVMREALEFSIDLSEQKRAHTIARINGLPFRQEGVYRFSVQLQEDGDIEWKEVASIPLELIIKAGS